MADLSHNKEKIKEFYKEIDQYPMLCQACGMCRGVCPKKAIGFSQNFAKQFVPLFDSDKCIGCMQCIMSCPVRINMSDEPSVIGSYYNIYLCKSINDEHVKNGSSGGVMTALLKYGMEQGLFEEVLTVSNAATPLIAEPLTTSAPVGEGGSKYIAAPLLREFDGKKKVAVTALPCQAKAIRRQNSDAFVFGLFCSKQQTQDLIEYFLRKEHRSTEEIDSITYRKGSWPGRFGIKFKDGTEISYNYGRSVFSAAFNSYYFVNSGCLLCDDYFAQSADIFCGDPWGKRQYVQEGYMGETVVIARTEMGRELVERALRDGVIVESGKMTLEEICKGHIKEIYNKKTALIQRIEWLKKETPAMNDYDMSTLIKADNFRLLNKYSIRNNWERRNSEKKYRKVFRVPRCSMFLTRFAHAFILAQRIKRSGIYKCYLDIAKSERIERKQECLKR